MLSSFGLMGSTPGFCNKLPNYDLKLFVGFLVHKYYVYAIKKGKEKEGRVREGRSFYSFYRMQAGFLISVIFHG